MDEELASIGPSELSRGAAVHDDYAALAEAVKTKAPHDDFDELEFGEHVDAGTLHLLYGSDTPLVEAMLEQGLMGRHVNEILGAGAVGASLAEDPVDFGLEEDEVEALVAQVAAHFINAGVAQSSTPASKS